jgi:hypothetical protein
MIHGTQAFFLLPAALFAVLVIAFAVGLRHDPHLLPSALIDRPAPDFALPGLYESTNGLTRKTTHTLVSVAQSTGLRGLGLCQTRAPARRQSSRVWWPLARVVSRPQSTRQLRAGPLKPRRSQFQLHQSAPWRFSRRS